MTPSDHTRTTNPDDLSRTSDSDVLIRMSDTGVPDCPSGPGNLNWTGTLPRTRTQTTPHTTTIPSGPQTQEFHPDQMFPIGPRACPDLGLRRLDLDPGPRYPHQVPSLGSRTQTTLNPGVHGRTTDPGTPDHRTVTPSGPRTQTPRPDLRIRHPRSDFGPLHPRSDHNPLEPRNPTPQNGPRVPTSPTGSQT